MYLSIGNTNTITEYLDGFQYLASGSQSAELLPRSLQFFPHAEGYVRSRATGPASSVYDYVFNYTDHLGNVRLSYSDMDGSGTLDGELIPVNQGRTGWTMGINSSILGKSHYYPFGLQQQGYNVGIGGDSKYKYNGQEYQSELGLNTTAMDFRQYDAAIGRFNVIDPLAEMDYSQTPYHFGYNNPNYWADPSGLKAGPGLWGWLTGLFGGGEATGLETVVIYNTYHKPKSSVMSADESSSDESRSMPMSITSQDGFSGGSGGGGGGFGFNINNPTFTYYKNIVSASIAKVSTITNVTEIISKRQIISKYKAGGDALEALKDFKSLDGLKGMNKFMQKAGYIGLAIDGFQVVGKSIDGTAKNSDYARFAINGALTVIAISNPIGMVAVGTYAIADYYYGDEIWQATGIDN